jgi:uncharacterized Zn finger protein
MRKRDSRIFLQGDNAPEEGMYECTSCPEPEKKVKVLLKEGDSFPKCAECGAVDLWRKIPSEKQE